MSRYRIGPAKASWHGDEAFYFEEGETKGDTVHDDGSWSEDQPTGILAPNGDMIWRCANRIGYRWSD